MTNEPPRKKKKRSHDPNIVMINGKPVSLSLLLNAPAKPSPPKEPTPPPAPEPTLIYTSVPEPSIADSTNGKQKGRFHGKNHRNSKFAENPKLLKTRMKLPMWAYRESVREALRKNDTLVVVGETGSGKSTQIPQFLFTEDWCQRRTVRVEGERDPRGVGGMIAVTQPRRVAATTLAKRVAQEAGCLLQRSEGLVGYSVRFDYCVPKGTRIKYLTEGMLLQELLADPYLRQYSAVVVDEIHERSVDVDLVAGFLKKIRREGAAGRGGVSLKVVVMSATADVDEMVKFFCDEAEGGQKQKVEVLKVKGRQFPVEVVHTKEPVNDLQESLLKTIFKVHTQEPLPGDILAFMTGQEDIETTAKLIEEYSSTLPSDTPKIKVCPLFGQMSMEAQHAAFLPLKGKFTRKIVLATNIAETSVTVPGVRYVIDLGKAKMKQFRTRLGMESLLARPISMSSAVQRTGRAGREGPGKCYRLYTKEGFESLVERNLPEILRTDLMTAILTMKAYGIANVQAFPLIDMPDIEGLENALIQLNLIGAVDKTGTITDLGKQISKLPLNPRFGAVMIQSANPKFDCLLEIIDIISCITAGEDIFLHIQNDESRDEIEENRAQLFRREGDLLTYLTTMQLYCSENADRTTWCNTRRINLRNMRQAVKIRKQLRGLAVKMKLISEVPPLDSQEFVLASPEKANDILRCFLKGFLAMTAMLNPDMSYQTVVGRQVVAIHPASVLHGRKVEAVMFLENVFTSKNYLKKVSVVQAQWLDEEWS